VPAPRLAALAIEEALSRANVPKDRVDEVLLGNVLAAGAGQAPDRQAMIFAGIPTSVPCSLINKVCASGMKATTLAAQVLAAGRAKIVVAGGMESMSNVPYYLNRGDTPYGGIKLIDGLVFDGLTDVYNKFHMGNCGENTAKKMGISRQEQDDYALESYRRAAEAYKTGALAAELTPVTVTTRKSETVVAEDDEYKKVKPEKFGKLPTVFQKEGGTVTAGNASSLSDGASACVMASEEAIKEMNLKPLARVVDFADGATDPIDFPIAPKFANERLLERAGLKPHEVDQWEINEAFSVVVLANSKILDLDPAKVNPHGGAVSLGHPLGASGSRITNHLVFSLKPGQKGVASICNGGGGATAVLIEKL